MVSQLSDEFQRLQTQLIELRTANEEQCKKYRSANEALSTKLGALERVCQIVQKFNSRIKLEAQDEDFRLQNRTLLQELSTLIAENEKLQQELTVVRTVDDAASTEGNFMGMEKEGHLLQAEITVNTKLLGDDHMKTKQTFWEQNETTQSVSTADIQKNETEAGQDDSVPSSEGDFVQVDEMGENQRQGSLWTDSSKQPEQKLQGLETYQRNLADVVMQLEAEQEERKRVQSEVKQLQEKLHRNQESFCQLQEEKERLYAENRRAYEKLQLEKEQEVGILKEQNQRLQVQLNNSQLSVQDLKRKSSQQIQELESRISLLTRKNESASEERLLELRAKVIELECVLGETREKLGHVQQQNSDLESHLADTMEKLNHKQTLVSSLEEEKTQLTSALDEVSLELLKKMTVSRTFPWKTGSFLLLLAVVALLSYDIKKHGSFHSSSTGHFLNDIGALQYGEHAWARTKFYSDKSYQWAEANVPHYYKLAGEHTKPYLELAWDVYMVAVHQLHKMYENIYAYVEEKMPAVIEWINSYAPGLLDEVKAYSTEAWEQVKQNAIILWQFFLQYLYMGLEWVKANVFVGTLSPENLQKFSMEALNTTQVYAAWTYNWVCEKVQTLSKIQ